MSNLLEKASIITTPTAYSDGKLHSVKPVQTLGDELVTSWTNKDFSAFTSNGSTITEMVSSGSGNNCYSSATFESGNKYKIEFNSSQNITAQIRISNNDSLTAAQVVFSNPVSGLNSVTFTANANYSFIGFYAAASFTDTQITNFTAIKITDADFDFQRGSAATRVNSQGLIENVQILSGNLVQNGDFSEIGSEIVTNGDFATDSDWNYTTSWEINNGKANFTNSSSKGMYQAKVLDANKTYKVSFDYYGNGQVGFLGTAGGSNVLKNFANYTEGNNVIYIKPTTSTSAFNIWGNWTGAFSIDNVSVKEVGQNWSFGTGWSIEDSVVNYNDTNTNTKLSQSLNIVANTTYKVSFTISNANTFARMQIGDASGYTDYIGTNNYSNGTYNLSFSNSGSYNTFAFTAYTDGSSFDITNISVKEITDDTDLPRIDYTDGCGSLLLEPQRTNSVTYSEDFSNSYYSKTNATVTSGFLAPDGSNNATKLVTSAVNAQLLFSAGSGNTSTKSISVFAKANTSTSKFKIIEQYYNGQETLFDLNLGVVEFNNSAGSKIEDYGNGWYKCTHIQSYSSGQTNASFGLRTPTAESLYIWGTQSEVGAYPTSYIPTQGSTATRLADVCNNAGSSDLINSTEGVLYAEISALADSLNYRFISISDGTNNNRIYLMYSNASNQIQVSILVGGVQSYSATHNLSSSIVYNKIALKWKLNDFSLYVNGVEVSTNNSNITFPANTLNKINFSNELATIFDFEGKVKSVVVFKEALTNDELEGLTGEGYDTFNALALANNYTII